MTYHNLQSPIPNNPKYTQTCGTNEPFLPPEQFFGMTRHKKNHPTASEKGTFEKGQSLVEFALVAIALLLSMFIIIESGRIFWAWNTVQNAAREGARYAVTGRKLPGSSCPVAHLPKFNDALQNNACRDADDFWLASVISVTHNTLAGLPINELSKTSSDPNYYDIYLYGVDKQGNFRGSLEPVPFGPDPYAGDPNQPMTVRVVYRVPIITPILSGIIPSVQLEGVITENNEPFGQLGNANQGIGVPPPPPPIPDLLEPTAVNDDTFTTKRDTPLSEPSLGILANDELRGGIITMPTPGAAIPTSQGGTVTVQADGSFVYVPSAGFEGSDSFEYQLENGVGPSNVATVIIIVNPPLPEPRPDSYEVFANEILLVPGPGKPNILDNDVRNGARIDLAQSSTTTGLGVTINLAEDGSFEYNPPIKDNDTAYTDTFAYTLTNAAGSAAATVTITILPPPPDAVDDAYFTYVDTPLMVVANQGVLANDKLYGTTVIASYDNPTTKGGSVTIQADGSFTYTPPVGFVSINNINDTFAYTLANGSGENTATVTIAVFPLVPNAKDDSQYTTPMNTPLSVTAEQGVLRNDTLNAATITAYDQTTTAGGRVNLAADGSFTYNPPTDYTSPPVDTFTYTLQNTVGSSVATVSIFVDPPFPIVFDDFYSTPIDTLLRVAAGGGLLANDVANSGTVSSFDSRSANGGTVMVNPNGSFDYTPPSGFESPPNDSFTYEVSNSSGTSRRATVQIFVGDAVLNNRLSGVARLVLPIPTPQEDVQVALYDVSNTLLAVTRTDLLGYYQFENLPLGSYTLTACYRLGNQEYSAVVSTSAPSDFADLFLTPGPCTNP